MIDAVMPWRGPDVVVAGFAMAEAAAALFILIQEEADVRRQPHARGG
ncbi:MAG TPA: hypothetical protein VGS13_15210 [Stellaceae bacterium]|nr:hypothetical protein [Stellaceae bacterium]